jgi:hypothetical protein
VLLLLQWPLYQRLSVYGRALLHANLLMLLVPVLRD